MKRRYWVIGAVIFVLFLIAGYMASLAIVDIRVRNEYPDKNISIPTLSIYSYLLEYGYYKKLDTLEVVYTDIPQDRMVLIDGQDKKIVQNVGISLDGRNLEIRAYYNPEKVDGILSTLGWVERNVYAYICGAFDNAKLGRSGCFQQAYDYYEAKNKTSLLQKIREGIQNLLSKSMVPTAYASCNGTIECGVWETECTCSEPGYSCDQPGTCGPGEVGTCSCGLDNCNVNPTNNLACSSLDSETLCLLVGNPSSCGSPYGGGECPIDQSCTWSPAGEPTPTPVPGDVDPAAVFRGRVWNDANGDDNFNDGDINVVQDPNVGSCGAYYDIPGGMEFEVKRISNGNIWNFHYHSVCNGGDGMPWSGGYVGSYSTYQVSPTPPSGWRVVNVRNNQGRCGWWNGSYITCDFPRVETEGPTIIEFLIRQDLPGEKPECRITSPANPVGPTTVNVCENVSTNFTVDGYDADGDLSSVYMSKAPTSGGAWSQFYNQAGDGTGSTSFSAGDWFVTCGAYDAQGNKCTGNQFCEWEPAPWSYNCGTDAWVNCDRNFGAETDGLVVHSVPAPGIPTTNSPNSTSCSDAVCLNPASPTVNLSWNSEPNSTSYGINLNREDNPWNTCVSPNLGDQCFYPISPSTTQVATVNACYTYGFRIRGENSSCVASAFSAWRTFNTLVQPTDIPTGLNPTGLVCNPPGNQVTLTWNTGSDCLGCEQYNLRVDRDPDSWNGNCLTPNPEDTCKNNLANPTFPLSVTSGRTYKWWVHYANVCGMSPASAVGTFTVLNTPGTPVPIGETYPACGFGATTAQLNWNAVAGATGYNIQIDQVPLLGAPSGTITCGANGDQCPTVGVVNFLDVTLDPGYTYYWRIAATNGCGPGIYSNPWRPINLDECSIDGTVYIDDYGLATAPGPGGICQFPGPGTLPTYGGGGTVTLQPFGTSAPIDVSGVYSVPADPTETHVASITLSDGSQSICPSTGLYGGLNSPSAGIDFFVSNVRPGWYQTVGGNVYGDSVGSAIPDTCDPLNPTHPCTPAYSLDNSVGDPGVVLYSGGILPSWGSGVSSSEAWVAQSSYEGDELGFDFWRREAGNVQTITALNHVPGGQGEFEFITSTSVALTGNWSNINQVKTIFVNFTSTNPADRVLTLNPNTRPLPQCPPNTNGDPGKCIRIGNGLLTIVTNGSIVVADDVLLIEGVYMADEVFKTSSIDGAGYDPVTGNIYQLQILGTVVAWGDIEFTRDLFLANNYTPAELFTYSPLFVDRLPDFFKRSIYTWEEIAP